MTSNHENVIQMFGVQGEESTQVEQKEESLFCKKCGDYSIHIFAGLCDKCFEKHGDLVEEEKIVDNNMATEVAASEEKAELTVQADGQFSLFGFDAVVEEQKAQPAQPSEPSCGEQNAKSSHSKAASKKPTSSSRPVVNRQTKPQDIVVTGDWSVHYATHSFRVSDFFNPMPPSGTVTLEELREKMFEEFFEMTRERTFWDYEEDLKRLYPDVRGMAKGGSSWL